MLLLSILLISSSSLFFASIFKFKSRVSYILTIYVFAYGNIALIGNVGHFFSLLGNPYYILFGQVFLLALTIIIWLKQKKPAIFMDFGEIQDFLSKKKSIRILLKNSDIIIFILFTLIGYLILAYLWYTVPPNNNDSISTHLPRVIYWIQHGNFKPWETSRIFQLMYPINSGLQFWWSILLTKSDKFVGFVQWVAALVGAISVYGISSLLGAKLQGRFLAGGLFLTLPSVVMQSTTTQNDLTAATLFGVSFYFLLAFIGSQEKQNLFLSGITLALVIGTKQTILYLLPGLGIIIILLWVHFKKLKLKQIIQFSGIVIVTFILIGSIIFFINYDYFGHPLGGKDVVDSSIQATSSTKTSISQISINSLRFLYQMIDPTGLPSPFWRWGIKLRAIVGGLIFNTLNIPIESDIHNTFPHKFSLNKAFLYQEDEAWFGLVGFLVLIPTFIYQSIKGLIKKDPIRISILIISVTFLIFLTLLRPGWDPYQGRYFLPIVLICSSYASTWFINSYPVRLIIPIISLIGVMTLSSGILYNPAKPLVDYPISLFYRNPEDPGYDQIHKGRKISSLNHFEKMSLQTFSNYKLCEFVNNNIPENTRVGYVISDSYYQEYCLFGRDFSKTLIPIYPQKKVYNEDFLISADIEFLLIYRADVYSDVKFNYFELISESSAPNIQIFKYSK